MARGRRPDAPGLQKAKGYPGKRKSKAEKQAEDAQRVAQLLVAASPTGDLSVPPVLHEEKFAPALAVWRDLAPQLMRTHRLPKESRLIFVQLCVYSAEWLEAELDIAENGYTQRVKTVAGGYMERKRPVVDRRERAFDNVLKLSERFGLTPVDIYSLFKDQGAAAANVPGLFEDAKPAAQATAAPPDASTPGTSGLVGAANRLRSLPPGTRPN